MILEQVKSFMVSLKRHWLALSATLTLDKVDSFLHDCLMRLTKLIVMYV